MIARLLPQAQHCRRSLQHQPHSAGGGFSRALDGHTPIVVKLLKILRSCRTIFLRPLLGAESWPASKCGVIIMTTHADDLAFVEKVANGDREAAELFLYRCQLWAGQLARMSSLPKQEWGDIANEALLTALGQMRRGMFRGDASFQTWVERIIRGKIADYWRASGNSQAGLIPLESALDEYQQEVERNVSLIQSLALRKTDEETRLMVRQALRAMSRQHAMVLLLNVREGYSTVEISQRLDLPQGTVGRKLAEAKKQFRQFFSDASEANSQRETTQTTTSETQMRKPETDISRKATLLWRIPIPHWPNLRSVPRRSFTTPLPISVLATPMNTSDAWLKSI